MNFRDTISKFYPLLSSKKDKVFMFFIGSYPARPDSNQELPLCFQNFMKKNVQIYRLYIDSHYSGESDAELTKRLGKDFLIYNNNITEYEYRMIIEFCHIAGILGNSLNLIMEFTGIQRNDLYMKSNRKDYLYITPSECLGNTDESLYNPILELNERRKYGFFHAENIDFLSNEIIKIFQNNIQDKNLEKLELLRDTLKSRVNDVEQIYRLLFNYMERKDVFNVEHEINFIKDKPFFLSSLELLKMRMGYSKKKTEEFIEEFLKDEETDFEIYVKQKIQNIFIDCLLLESNGDEIVVNNKFESVIFENAKDVYSICQRFKQIFKDVNVI